MAKFSTAMGRQGPAIRAIDPWASSAGRMQQLLTDEERARLAVIASIVRFKKRAVIYREGDRADAIFNIISGVAAAYKKAPDGSEHITAFLLPDDLLGLSEEGKYTNSSKAIVCRCPLYGADFRKMLRWNFTSFASFARNFVKRSAMVSSSAKEALSPRQ